MSSCYKYRCNGNGFVWISFQTVFVYMVYGSVGVVVLCCLIIVLTISWLCLEQFVAPKLVGEIGGQITSCYLLHFVLLNRVHSSSN